MTTLLELHYTITLVVLTLGLMLYHLWQANKKLAIKISHDRQPTRFARTKYFLRFRRLPKGWMWWEDFCSQQDNDSSNG